MELTMLTDASQGSLPGALGYSDIICILEQRAVGVVHIRIYGLAVTIQIMKPSKLTILTVLVIAMAAAGTVWWMQSKNTQSTTDTAAAEKAVTDFGAQLKKVSLMAPQEVLVSTITEAYEPYVTPELLAEWMSDPASAPGRLTSSPWPERIEIASVTPSGESYIVEGEIILMTSVEETGGGNAGVQPITLVVSPYADEWRISSVEITENAR